MAPSLILLTAGLSILMWIAWAVARACAPEVHEEEFHLPTSDTGHIEDTAPSSSLAQSQNLTDALAALGRRLGVRLATDLVMLPGSILGALALLLLNHGTQAYEIALEIRRSKVMAPDETGTLTIRTTREAVQTPHPLVVVVESAGGAVVPAEPIRKTVNQWRDAQEWHVHFPQYGRHFLRVRFALGTARVVRNFAVEVVPWPFVRLFAYRRVFHFAFVISLLANIATVGSCLVGQPGPTPADVHPAPLDGR